MLDAYTAGDFLFGGLGGKLELNVLKLQLKVLLGKIPSTVFSTQYIRLNQLNSFLKSVQ